MQIYLIVKESLTELPPAYTDIAFTDRFSASKYCEGDDYLSHRQITLYEDYDKYFTSVKQELIKSGLSKLTKHEKEALGL